MGLEDCYSLLYGKLSKKVWNSWMRTQDTAGLRGASLGYIARYYVRKLGEGVSNQKLAIRISTRQGLNSKDYVCSAARYLYSHLVGQALSPSFCSGVWSQVQNLVSVLFLSEYITFF